MPSDDYKASDKTLPVGDESGEVSDKGVFHLLRQACEDSPCRCRDNGIPESRHGESAVPRRGFGKSSESKGISRT